MIYNGRWSGAVALNPVLLQLLTFCTREQLTRAAAGKVVQPSSPICAIGVWPRFEMIHKRVWPKNTWQERQSNWGWQSTTLSNSRWTQMDRTVPWKSLSRAVIEVLIIMLSSRIIGAGGVSGEGQCIQQLPPTVQLNNGVQSETKKMLWIWVAAEGWVRKTTQPSKPCFVIIHSKYYCSAETTLSLTIPSCFRSHLCSKTKSLKKQRMNVQDFDTIDHLYNTGTYRQSQCIVVAVGHIEGHGVSIGRGVGFTVKAPAELWW